MNKTSAPKAEGKAVKVGKQALQRTRLATVFESLRFFLNQTVASSSSRIAISAFSAVIVVFSALLMLPFSSADGKPVAAHDAIFTATSAVTVTGLTTVSTSQQWSFLGQLIILIAFQIGGLGTLTMTSLLSIAAGRKLGLRSRIIAQEAMNIGKLGELGSVLKTVVYTSVSIEGAIALLLTPRFLILGEGFWQSIWHGIFYSVSAFNNAGFVLHDKGLIDYGHDLWILLPICLAVFIGALGFPVILAIQQNPFKFRRWNLNTKLTVLGTLALLVIGMIAWGLLEWGNQKTIGSMSFADKVLNSFFASVMTRSGGFNLVDMNEMDPVTLLLTDILMFIGGGSASTAGGVKITTVTVVILAVIAEARGDQFVIAFNRTIPDSVLRIAISVIMMSGIIVFAGTASIVYIADVPLDRALFEVISAYATCGLSVGLSASLPPSCVYILVALMFAGRVGIITLATGLALRSRRRLYKFPEERPLIG